MPGTLEDYAAAVTDVISICRDAEQGFRAAADAVNQPALKQMFEQYSEQRARFASELQEAVRSMGFDTPHPSGAAGVLHGAWMSIKGALTGHSEHAILSETERGEDRSLEIYRNALSKNMPVAMLSIVEQQFEQIQQAHDHIRQLRDATEPKDSNDAGPQTPVVT